jgi:hypothetical protein
MLSEGGITYVVWENETGKLNQAYWFIGSFQHRYSELDLVAYGFSC